MEFNKFAEKLSYKLEDNRGATSHKVIQVKLNNYDSYVLYTTRPNDVRIIEELREFMIIGDEEVNSELVKSAIEYIVRSHKGVKRLSLLKTYLIGLNERGINICLVTSGVKFFVAEEFEPTVEIYRSTTSINELTAAYRYRSLNSQIYEELANEQGNLTEFRIGDFSALYCIRKFYKKFFPERVSEMYVAGKTIEIYDVHNWDLPKVSKHVQRRRPRVS